MTRVLILLLVTLILSGCVARKAASAAGSVTSTAIRTTGAVVGGAVDIVTRNAQPEVRTYD